MLSLGIINIYWYGFFIVSGILLAIFLAIKLSSYYEIKKDNIIDLSFWAIAGGIIGARLYHVFIEWSYYKSNIFKIIAIWQGGLAIHGALIGGLIAFIIFTKKNKINIWPLIHISLPGIALAQSIGRWGNYFNQELFGKPTNLSWGIPISENYRLIEFYNENFFHPTFLYESIGNFIIFIILFFLIIYFIKNNKIILLKKRGLNYIKILPLAFYLILYSILRFYLEYVRIDQTTVFLNIRLPQIVSIFIILLAILLLLLPKFSKDDIIK